MKKVISVISAKLIADLILNITFDDKHNIDVNFSNFLNQTKLPDLIKYRNKENFKKFKIINGNLIWGDYEMMFPLNSLYFNTLLPPSKKGSKAS